MAMFKLILMRGLSVFLVTIMISGCSTLFGRHHDDQNVMFDSNIQNLEVICSGKKVYTPGSLPLRQSKSHVCTATAPGYEKQILKLKSGVSWSGFGHSTATNTATWGWWTLGVGTAVGWLVDLPAGSMRNLKDDSIYFDMKPKGSTPKSEKIILKTAQVVKSVVELPVEVVQETATAIIGGTVKGTADALKLTPKEEEKEGEEEKEEDAY